MLQTVIGHQCANEIQPLQILHARQRSQRIIQNVGIPQIERLQIDQSRKAVRVLDGRIIQPKMLELGVNGAIRFTPSSPMSSQASVVSPA